ncbi:MAG: flippase [Candidatus Micrarchaeota archaeon]
MVDGEISANGPLKTIFKSAGLFFAGMLFGKAVFYVFRLLVARLGYEEYGTFSLALGVFDIINAIALLGVGLAIQKMVAEQRVSNNNSRINELIYSGLKVVLVSGTFFALLVFIFAEEISVGFFHNPGLTQVLQVIAAAVPFYAMTSVLFGVFRAYEKVKYEIFTKQFVESSLKLGMTVIFLYFGFKLMGIAIAYLAATIVSFLLAAYFMVHKTHNFLGMRGNRKGAEREILAFSLPLMFAGIVYTLLAWTDVFFLGHFRTSAEVGIYNAALPTAALLITIPIALNMVFLPISTGLIAARKNEEFRKIYSILAKWSFGANFAIFTAFAFFGKQVLRVLFGYQYEIAALPLQILAFGYLCYSVFFNSADVLSALSKPRKVLMHMVIAAIVNLLLNYNLVPEFGVSGAALSTSASLILFGGLNVLTVYTNTRALPFNSDFLKIIFSGIISMLGTVYLFKLAGIASTDLNLVLLAAVYGLGYLALVLLLRIPDRTDFEMLLAVEKRVNLNLSFIKKPLKKYFKFE